MADLVHLFPGGADEAGTVLISSQITLCCKTWVGDNRVKLGTIHPDAVTCSGSIDESAPSHSERSE